MDALGEELRMPGPNRLRYVADAFRAGLSLEGVHRYSRIDPWFLAQIEDIVREEQAVQAQGLEAFDRVRVRALKRKGFSDRRLATLLGMDENSVRRRRITMGIRPVFKRVDTCAAEFATSTAYMYSTYDEECEAAPTDRKKIMILGGGPNRIGQGIEFDYCCVHAALALRQDGIETIMVNCNPETVSTDYDTSDKLFFEPLTLEDTLALIGREKPEGVIVQFGGQTPLRLAVPLERAGVPILGTSPDSIDRAEDRERFEEVLAKLELRRPRNGMARSTDEAIRVAEALGYPVLARPSYVLGGRAMEIVYDRESLARYMRIAVHVSPEHPILIDQFLEDAIEVDVDAVSDGKDVVIGGIMEHIERAGVHSGDSACSLPPYSIDAEVQAEIRRQTVAMARELRVVGLMNVQFAVKARVVYVLEVNPRASRTVPFVSKAIGVPLAKVAARCMAGRTLREQGVTGEIIPAHTNVKEAVFPFIKFPGVDTVLGPEMKSTGEVMGIDGSFGAAFAKAQVAAGTVLPTQGRAFISVPESDWKAVIPIARRLARQGFILAATRGTAAQLREAGLSSEVVNKVQEGEPHIVAAIQRGDVALVINTPSGAESVRDSIAAATAAAEGIELMRRGPFKVLPLQEHHRS
jgi:carbamoyl-phosphate synthase large subunit